MQEDRLKHIGDFINNAADYIISGITEFLCIVVLEDDCGWKSNIIGSNRVLNLIYDCRETHEMQIHRKNLSNYGGPNRVFVKFCITAEIRDNKLHEKN